MGITITETRVQDKSSGALNIKDIINIVYPVGSIYMSVNDTDPSLLFHGTWEQIKDRFLLSAGNSYTAGSTGGEATNTLDLSNMPSRVMARLNLKNSAASTNNENQGTGWRDICLADQNEQEYGKPHNNMPPYLTVYVWKRIA